MFGRSGEFVPMFAFLITDVDRLTMERYKVLLMMGMITAF